MKRRGFLKSLSALVGGGAAISNSGFAYLEEQEIVTPEKDDLIIQRESDLREIITEPPKELITDFIHIKGVIVEFPIYRAPVDTASFSLLNRWEDNLPQYEALAALQESTSAEGSFLINSGDGRYAILQGLVKQLLVDPVAEDKIIMKVEIILTKAPEFGGFS